MKNYRLKQDCEFFKIRESNLQKKKNRESKSWIKNNKEIKIII